jgi:hypothetical protein
VKLWERSSFVAALSTKEEEGVRGCWLRRKKTFLGKLMANKGEVSQILMQYLEVIWKLMEWIWLKGPNLLMAENLEKKGPRRWRVHQFSFFLLLYLPPSKFRGRQRSH